MQNSDSFQFHSEVPPHTGERTFSYHSHSLEDDAKTHAKKTKNKEFHLSRKAIGPSTVTLVGWMLLLVFTS